MYNAWLNRIRALHVSELKKIVELIDWPFHNWRRFSLSKLCIGNLLKSSSNDYLGDYIKEICPAETIYVSAKTFVTLWRKKNTPDGDNDGKSYI